MGSKKNKSIRIALAQVYGSGCMFKKSGAEKYIEKLGHIKTYKKFKEERHYTSKKIKALENLLTLHHLKHKSEGGKASIENGAIVNSLAHQYMHSLPRNQEEVINDYLREYKKQIESQELPVIIDDSLEAPFEISCAEISLEDNKFIVRKLTEKEIKKKEKAKEKRELQRIRKEFEDR